MSSPASPPPPSVPVAFTDLADLEPVLIGAALRAAGVTSVDPVAVDVRRIDDGSGFLGTLARLVLSWPDPNDGPGSIVAKLPTTVEANREIVDRFGYDRREAGVYRDLRPWEHAPTPRALAQGWDDTTGRGWLLLDDHGDLVPGDGLTGATDDEAFATVTALAAWHAAWWNDPSLTELAWLPASTDPVVAGYGQIFDITWDMCVDRLGGVDDHTAAAVAAARPLFDAAVAAFSEGDRTVVHGDARLDNLRFGPAGAILLDFQLAALGRGVYDVAFFCAGSLETDDRRRLEPALLERYRDALAGHGVATRLDELWHDYRLGHMLNMPNPVSALAVVTPTDERGAAFLHRNAQRGLAAVADHVGLLS